MARTARLLAIGFISGGTLAYEILLVRAFAIEHFHHFAYMAIGVAMLGFGVAGTLLALRPIRPANATRWFVWSAAATGALLVASPAMVHLVRLDTTQLAWDAGQWLRLAVVEGCLALPFGAGALTVLLALAAHPENVGRLYGASFAGSGFGAVVALGCMWILPPVQAIAIPAVLAACGTLAASLVPPRGRGFTAAAAALLLVTVSVPLAPPWSLEVSQYKALPQVEAFPGARRVFERSHPAGWLVGIEAPAFRLAPGMSLGYVGDFPAQTGLFVDGEVAGAVADWSRDSAAAVLDWLPTALPFTVTRPARVMIIGAAGGTEVANAIAHGAEAVTAVELHPALVELGDTLRLPGASSPDRVRWVSADARSFVAGSGERFDVITLAAAGAMGASTAGLHSLAEDFLHTTEAYVSYLRHLTPSGVLAITRWLTIPPRESARVVLTAAAALRQYAPDRVAEGLVVARSWGTVTVLVRPAGFTPAEIDALREWTAERFFDLDWYPGGVNPSAPFNVLDEPALYRAAAAAVAGADSARRFADDYPFDIAPVTDARPYPHRFLRVASLPHLIGSGRGDWIPFAEWGPVALFATLIQSAVLAGALMVVPAALVGRIRRGQRWPRLVGYFTAIGLAYLTAEIAAIQQFGLLLGHPVYAVAIVLTVFLVASGFGSAWSDRLPPARSRTVTAALAVLLLGCAAALLGIVHALQPAPLLVRGAVAAAVIVPVAFLMGAPFPVGLRRLAGNARERIAWSWAANGFASVVAAPLAAIIALEAGSPVLFLLAAAAYGGASVLAK